MEPAEIKTMAQEAWVDFIKDLIMAFGFAFIIGMGVSFTKLEVTPIGLLVAILFYNFRAMRRVRELSNHVNFMNDKFLSTLQTHQDMWDRRHEL